MDSSRRVLGFRIALSAAAAVLVLAGASLNASGRDSGGIALAGVTGLLAVPSGVLYREGRPAVPLGGGPPRVTSVMPPCNTPPGVPGPQGARRRLPARSAAARRGHAHPVCSRCT